jgi:PhnB protein
MEFYSRTFNQKMPDEIMTYAQNPDGADEADKNRILYACMPIFGCNVMFSDCPSDFNSIKGNNIMLTIGLDDEHEIKRIFNALAEDGEIGMELEHTFFNELFGMVTDKFGIIWQISKTPSQS